MIYRTLPWLPVNPSVMVHDSPCHVNPSVAPSDFGESPNSWMWIPRPSIVWPLTFTRVLIFPSFSGTLYVTLICIRFPLYTELFQIPMPVVMPFPLLGMPHPFPSAPLFCLTHSYSSFDLSKLPDWTENSHNNICPPHSQKLVLLPLYRSSTWLSRYTANYVPQHACKS